MSIVIATLIGLLAGLGAFFVVRLLDRPKPKKLDKATEMMLEELGRLAREQPLDKKDPSK